MQPREEQCWMKHGAHREHVGGVGRPPGGEVPAENEEHRLGCTRGRGEEACFRQREQRQKGKTAKEQESLEM